MIEALNLDEITEEEVHAHQELKKYADAIKTRQQKYKMIDVAEFIVDNKMLINRVDDMLQQKHSADEGKQYHEIPNMMASVSADDFARLAPVSSRDYLGGEDEDELDVDGLYEELVGTKSNKNKK
jgi:hypothetical protein